MSEDDSPQPEDERVGADGATPATPDESGDPTATPGQPQVTSIYEALDRAEQGQPVATDATPEEPKGVRSPRLRRLVTSRASLWAAVAVLCIAAGTIASVLAAHAVVHNDTASGRTRFHQSSTAVASTLKVAIQHQEDPSVSATTYFAENPKATVPEFEAWSKWARELHRNPSLQNLALVAVVRAAELPAKEAGLAGKAFAPVPSGKRPFYCLTVAELARSHSTALPRGVDYCALTSALLASRDSGLGTSAAVTVGDTKALAVVTPVYRGAVPPATAAGRTGAFVGWLREVLAPGVLLGQALRGHPETAVRLRYRTASTNAVFTSGTAPAGAQNRTINLHGGWTVKVFGASTSPGILSDGRALTVLIGGILLSVLVGLLAFALGAGRRRSAVGADQRQPREDLYDALTGLPNRALTLDRADRMIARATRQSGMLAGALFIDIDWLRDFNDKFGQDAGDQLLKTVAERLEGVVRANDTVGRLGGDEFVILVESAARGVRLDSLARRVIESLHEPVEIDGFGPSFVLTASIGVAFGRYTTPSDLLRDAHLALYAAKAAGKDRYTLFNANMRSVIEGRGALEVELNGALQDGQFFLMYEPIYDLSARSLAGFEARILWQHPVRGVVPCADFMPLAEETGLIVPIGRWMLEQACTRAAAWCVAGHRLGVSVKVAENQLHRDGFVTDVRRALQQSGVEPSLLTLQIAETAIIRDVDAASGRLQQVRQLGVRIAIDGFGSGYARHGDLQRLPVDSLRVDRRTLAASEDGDYPTWLLRTILIVGDELSLTVVATGIETHEQLIALEQMGFRMAQGPVLGKAAATDAIEEIVHAGFPPPPEPATGTDGSTPVSTSETI